MIRTSSFNRLAWNPDSAIFLYVCSKTVWWLTLLNHPSSLGSRLSDFQVSLLDKLLWTVVLKILDGMLNEVGYVLPPRKCITFLKYEIVFMHPRCNSSTRTRGMWNTLSPRKKNFLAAELSFGIHTKKLFQRKNMKNVSVGMTVFVTKLLKHGC